MRVREECKPDSEDVQIQGPRRDPHQELMLLEKLTGNYRLTMIRFFYMVMESYMVATETRQHKWVAESHPLSRSQMTPK